MNQEAIDKYNAEQARKAELQDHTDQIVGAVGTGNNDITKSIHDLALATFVGKDPRMVEVAKNLADLLTEIATASGSIKDSKLNLLPYANVKLAESIKALADGVATDKQDLQKRFDTFNEQLSKIAGTQPVVNLPEQKIDFSPLISEIKNLKPKEVKIPNLDTSNIVEGLNEVADLIRSQKFPVPNYVLPFKDINGKATQVQLDSSGNIPTSGGGSGGGGTQYAELVTTAPATGTVALGRYKSSAPTLTDGQLYAPQLDVNGNLKVAGTFSSTPPADIAPATQNITIIDSSSSSAAGANNQTIIIGTPTAGSAASFALSSIETVRVEVTGIWTGTIATETSIDGGTTWVNQGVHQGAYTTSSFTAGFVGGANVSGCTNFRLRATAAITGTVVVKVIESVNTQSVYVANAAPSGNIVSVLNSSASTLTSGSVYTGTLEDVSNFAEMRVSVISDVASATDGLSIQQSSNGTNWDITDVYTIPAATGKTFVVPRQAKFLRIVYTNGGTNQTSFRLQTILDRMPTAPSSQRPSDSRSNDNDMVEMLSYGNVYDSATNTWSRSSSGNGVTGLGTQRVTLSSDSTGQVKLTTGAALVGKVGIDQTTPGTTNAVSANQGTAAALASGWPVLNGEASDTAGTFTNATQTTSVTATSLDGYGNVLISINGTYGTATAIFEGSDDGGTTWYGISEADRTDSNIIESGYTSLTNTSRAWQISNPGWDSVRVRSTAVASGTVNVRISPSAAPTSAGASVSIGIALPTGANTIGALTANQSVNESQINGVTPLMGNGVTGTGSQRVTIASDNTAFAVNATLSAETTKVIGTVNQGTSPWVTNDPGIPDTLGQKTMANSTGVVLASDQTSIPVTLTSTTITSEIPGVGATNLGKAEDAVHASGDTGVMALSVANEALTNISGTDGDYTIIASDRNGTIHVAQKASTATLSNVAGSATSVTLLSANAARIGAQITNDSSAVIYIKFGITASTTSYTVVLAGAASAPFSYYEVPAGYTGRIDAIWASATGNARCTEITP